VRQAVKFTLRWTGRMAAVVFEVALPPEVALFFKAMAS
jgi:hypothetical protein